MLGAGVGETVGLLVLAGVVMGLPAVMWCLCSCADVSIRERPRESEPLVSATNFTNPSYQSAQGVRDSPELLVLSQPPGTHTAPTGLVPQRKDRPGSRNSLSA